MKQHTWRLCAFHQHRGVLLEIQPEHHASATLHYVHRPQYSSSSQLVNDVIGEVTRRYDAVTSVL